jgi:DNA-binding NarL/FixJ family response regulator
MDDVSLLADGREMAAAAQPNPRIRVLLADDNAIIRRMVRSTLEQNIHIEICGEAEDGVQAVEQAKQIVPDVTVLNITMPILNGFDAAREIRKQVPHSAIVILSTHADKFFIEEAKKIGAQAYVSKSKVGDALVRAVEAAVQGGDFVLLE